MVVDRAGRLGGQRTGAIGVGGGDRSGRPVGGTGHERLGGTGAHDRRCDRPEAQAHRPVRPVDGETGAGDGDDHGVADADLGVALPPVEHRHGHGGDQLAGLQRRALDADHELGDRHARGVRSPSAPRPRRPGRRGRGVRRPPASTWRGCPRWWRRCGSAASRRCGRPGPAPARATTAASVPARRTSRRRRGAACPPPGRGPSRAVSGSRRTDSTVRSSATSRRDSLTSTITSVPPASTMAVGTSTSAASASSSDVGVRTDTGGSVRTPRRPRRERHRRSRAPHPVRTPSGALKPSDAGYSTVTAERSSSGSGYCGSRSSGGGAGSRPRRGCAPTCGRRARRTTARHGRRASRRRRCRRPCKSSHRARSSRSPRRNFHRFVGTVDAVLQPLPLLLVGDVQEQLDDRRALVDEAAARTRRMWSKRLAPARLRHERS